MIRCQNAHGKRDLANDTQQTVPDGGEREFAVPQIRWRVEISISLREIQLEEFPPRGEYIRDEFIVDDTVDEHISDEEIGEEYPDVDV